MKLKDISFKETEIKSESRTAPRIGHIDFLNCLPLYYGLQNNGFLLNIELLPGKPTELSKMLFDGQLDMAPIPSIEYGRNYKDLKLLSDISVSSDGQVKSILLISKVPPEELNEKKVYLTKASATSQVLLRIILSAKYKVTPFYKQSSKPVLEALKEAEAALAIGDEALDLYYEDLDGLFKYDLGRQWQELSSQKMVYAVWAVRKDFAEKHPQETLLLAEAFAHSISYSKKCLDDVAVFGAKSNHLSAEVLKEYFRALRFDFDEQYQTGLLYFYKQAFEQGLLKERPILSFC